MRMRRGARIGGVAVIAALALLLAGSTEVAANGERPASAEVKIDNFSFGPATITVAVGTSAVRRLRDRPARTIRGRSNPR